MLSPRIITDLSIATVATAGTLTYAALSPQSQLFGRTILAGKDPNEIALTYDDGPNDDATLALLDLLAQHNARATFFMIGRFVRERRDLVRAVHAAGHLIGNHTTTHPWFTACTPSRTREELTACTAALEDAIGESIRYVRFPHGARWPHTIRIAHELNLTPIQWNITAFDWQPIAPEAILAHIDRGLASAHKRNTGANILLHDGHQSGIGADRSATIAATAQLLARFHREGKRLVTPDAWA
jgi:peptidoglycan/xylan/chitin deacetylase (PgdA/CDA1 family)